ncbi:MAG TPA: hypothetical protein VM779_06745 [Thermoanaerobaculia bacterium]|nr:hypothetical protein [Thermoanaerobaculia bacterium]
MKQLLMLAAILLFAFAATADEKEKSTEPAKSESTSAAEEKAESPLAAAARRTQRGKSTSIVITDEMVKTSKGHVTSTTIQYNPKVPPKAPPTSEMKMLEARAAEKKAAEKKAAEAKVAEEKKQQDLARRARLAEAADEYEDGTDEYGADPAQLEQEMAAEAKKQEKRP